MNKIIVMTDSTCDLSNELIKQHDIKVFPLHVTFPNESNDYLDGVNIFLKKFTKDAKNMDTLLKLAQLILVNLLIILKNLLMMDTILSIQVLDQASLLLSIMHWWQVKNMKREELK